MEVICAFRRQILTKALQTNVFTEDKKYEHINFFSLYTFLLEEINYGNSNLHEFCEK